MQFTEALNPANQPTIKQYASGRLLVDETWYTTPILVTAEAVKPFPALQEVSELSDTFLQQHCDTAWDLLIVGTGEKSHYCPPLLMSALHKNGIALEYMTTAAACRTYLILRAEERPVATLLFP